MAAKKSDRSHKNKPVPQDKSAAKSFSLTRAKEFFGEVKSEFKKIVWPDKKVTVGSTGVVIVVVFIISFYLGIIDIALSRMVTAMFGG